MRFTSLALPEVLLVEPDVYRDSRGFFLETYHAGKYRDGGIPETFVQDNLSRSVRGILRGLHSQRQHLQGKLIRVVEGEIFDVAVDVRRGSPTFAHWVSVVLSGENFRQCYVPPGFAHGFAVTSETAVVEYKVTDFYDPADEITILWNDPALRVAWPIQDPVLSAKDARGLALEGAREWLPIYAGPRP
jgi:dTDP-4-dehydrorhamnose 3,5-epimerase